MLYLVRVFVHQIQELRDLNSWPSPLERAKSEILPSLILHVSEADFKLFITQQVALSCKAKEFDAHREGVELRSVSLSPIIHRSFI